MTTPSRHSPPHPRNAGAPSVPAMSPDPRHQLGRVGERLAREHLERLGLQILASNYRTRAGELDLVAFDGETIVFVEVKTRREGPGSVWDALHPAKRRQVRAMAAAWLNDTVERPRSAELRFDAIGVTIDATGRMSGLDHLEAAY